MSTPVGHDSRKPRRRYARRFLRRPRTFRGWLAAIAGVLVVAVVAAYLLARMTPPWYAPLDSSSTRVIDMDGRVESVVVASDLHNAIQRVPLGDQRWTITQQEVNSVLAVHFPPPLNAGSAGSYPAGALPVFSGPCVIFSPGKVTIAARTTRLPGNSPLGGVASITLSVEVIAPPGGGGGGGATGAIPQGRILIEHAWVGDLPVPASLVTAKVRALMPSLLAALDRTSRLSIPSADKILPQIEDKILAVEQGDPFPLHCTFEHRTFIIKEIHVEDGSLTVVLGPVIPAVVPPRPLP